MGYTPTAVVLGSSLQVFYYDAGRGNLRHAWLSGNVWRGETLEGDAGSVSGYSANIGLEPTAVVYDNTMHVYYYDVSKGNLRHARTSMTSGWRFENLDGDPGSIAGLDANVGHNPTAFVYRGDMHVIYSDTTTGKLRHMWTGLVDGWRAEDLVGTQQSSIKHTSSIGQSSTAVVIDNVLHLFVYENTNQNLVHIWDDGSGWKIENLDGYGGEPAGRLFAAVGTDPTVLNINGKPHVFYYDASNGNLRHAWAH